MRAAAENIGSHRRSTLDSHLLTALEFKQAHLCREGSRKGLGVTDKASRGQCEVVSNFEQLLDALIGNEVPHSCSVIRAYDDSAIETDS
jgi:hypothetical protein